MSLAVTHVHCELETRILLWKHQKVHSRRIRSVSYMEPALGVAAVVTLH